MKTMLKRWRKKIFWSGLILSAIGASLFIYAGWIEPNRLVIHEETIVLNRWDKSLDGFKVAAISDIHGGSDFIDEAKIRQIVETTNAQNPDLIVLLGDFVSQVHEDKPIKERELKLSIETIAENLQGFRAKYGVFAVIGNHDWWYDEKRCRTELEKAGFTVLENETKSFEVNGKNVTILGIEDFWKRRKVQVDDILAKLPNTENIIGITHNPDSFAKTPDSLAILFAGHSHGGQVKFPILGAPIVPNKKEFTAGHISKNGKNLFVTTGVGTSGLSIRFRVPPEIAVVTLKSQN
jgi:predicted MPP superfamily phosphohydrolase